MLVRLKILNYDFEQLFNDKSFFLVEGLNLRYLFIFFEILGEFIEGRKEVGDHVILFVLAGIPQFFKGVDHHDELFESIDAESQIFLSDVQRLEILAHIVDNLLALLGLFLNDADLTDDLARQCSCLFDLFADFDVHHGVLVDLLDELPVDLAQLCVEALYLPIQSDQRLLVGELSVEICDGIKVGLLKLLAHINITRLYRGKRMINLEQEGKR